MVFLKATSTYFLGWLHYLLFYLITIEESGLSAVMLARLSWLGANAHKHRLHTYLKFGGLSMSGETSSRVV